MRIYSNEEYKIIQDILGKDVNDHYYTDKELTFVNDFDFTDEALPKIAKLVWKNRNNPKKLKKMLEILNNNEIYEYNQIFTKVQKVGVAYVSNN